MRNKILTGVAGEYYVAAELSRHGYVASLTSKNTKGIDLLVSNQKGDKTASVQIKTNATGLESWILNKGDEAEYSDKLFYVFVALPENGYPRFYVVPSLTVATYIKKSHHDWLTNVGKSGNKRNDTSMRKYRIDEDKYRDAWHLLGLDDEVKVTDY